MRRLKYRWQKWKEWKTLCNYGSFDCWLIFFRLKKCPWFENFVKMGENV